MLRVFEQKDVFQYDPQRGRFRDWLGTLVRNKVVERRRRASERVRAQRGDGDDRLAQAESDAPTPDAAWEAAFERALLVTLLDAVRREMNPRDYLAFKLLAIQELPGAAVAKITGLSRNAAYKARRRALQRLSELGQPYRDRGQLADWIKQALGSLPSPAVERILTTGIEKTMRSR